MLNNRIDGLLEIDAVKENLTEVLSFIGENLEKAGCSMKAQMQIALSVEEIFVNIASYAYPEKKGKAVISICITGDPAEAELVFSDRGVPYNPLEKADPDVSLSAAERRIGGLGIYLVKKNMDGISYEYRDGQNILKLRKKI